MLFKAGLDDRQDFLIHQPGYRILHHALFFRECAANVEQIRGIQCVCIQPGSWTLYHLVPPESKPAPSYHRGLYCCGPPVKIPEIIIVETIHQPGSLASVLMVIAEAGLAIEHLTALRRDQGRTVWEITLEMDEEANRSLYERIDQLPIARFLGKSD